MNYTKIHNHRSNLILIILTIIYIFTTNLIADAPPDTNSVFLYSEKYSRSYIPDMQDANGVAFRDINGDDLPDIYITSHRGKNRLLMNRGAYRPFRDVTELSGLSGILRPEGVFSAELGITTFDFKFGSCLADIDNDGNPDIIISGWGITTALYRNIGDLRFRNISDNLNFVPPIDANTSIVGDVNNDGLLDIFITDEHYSNRMLFNLGEGIFQDRTEESGLKFVGMSKGASFCDIDGDLDLDLYVCNWYGPDLFYRNLGDGRFTQMILPITVCTENINTNGVSFGDIDNDGDSDLFITIKDGHNFLYMNDSLSTDSSWQFVDISHQANIVEFSKSYSSVIADFNNDCWQDIFVTNDGFNQLYLNNGNLTFKEIFEEFNEKDFSIGCSSSDFDLDGDLDLIVANKDKYSMLLRNITDDSAYVKLKIIGVTSNRDAIGARLYLYKSGHLGNQEYLLGSRDISGGGGYLSFNDPIIHFGLDTTKIVDIRIQFPSGRVVNETELLAGQTYEIYEFSALNRSVIQAFQHLAYLMQQVDFWYKVILALLFFTLTIIFIRLGLVRYKWTPGTASTSLGGFFLMALILIFSLNKLGVLYIFLATNILTIVFVTIFIINSERLYKLRRIRERYRSVLIELSNRIVNIHDDEKLFSTVVEYLFKNTEFKDCCVLSYQENKGIFKDFYSNNLELPIPELNSQESIKDFINIIKNDKYLLRKGDKKFAPVFNLLKSEIFILIERNECVYGLLSLGAPPPVPTLTQEDIDLFKSISNQMAITIENNDYIRQSNEMIKRLTEAEVREKYLDELEKANASLDSKNKELQKLYDELKNTQTQLIHSEKMASLGQLVAGISHEMNNPIGFIYANVKQLKTYIKRIEKYIDEYSIQQKADTSFNKSIIENTSKIFPDIQSLISDTIHGSQMVKDLVDNLRSFSHLDQAQWQDVDIHEGLDSSLMILRPELKDRIKIHKKYNLKKSVACNPGQLNQVFMNLLANAAQAIEGEGNIWIGTLIEKNHAMINIKDDGKGIPEKIKDKIFDPFFTTKDIGKGIGLGLSISYSIIKNHRGTIQVKSKPGEGTTFKIKIPLHSEIPSS